MTKMKISEWLGQMDGHDIMGRADAMADFEESTGLVPDSWPSYSKEDMQRQIDQDTGKAGGYLEGDGPYVPVLDLSNGLAISLADYYSQKWGRGSRHRDNVEALKEAGF
jgi:hypothetical protein